MTRAFTKRACHIRGCENSVQFNGITEAIHRPENGARRKSRAWVPKNPAPHRSEAPEHRNVRTTRQLDGKPPRVEDDIEPCDITKMSMSSVRDENGLWPISASEDARLPKKQPDDLPSLKSRTASGQDRSLESLAPVNEPKFAACNLLDGDTGWLRKARPSFRMTTWSRLRRTSASLADGDKSPLTFHCRG